MIKKLISKEEVLSFDDVILEPGYSSLSSRKNISTTVSASYNNRNKSKYHVYRALV